MALKEHPFVVTSSFTADGTTIIYDKNVENRSTAVGKAFKINADGKAELVADGDEIVGKVLAVDDDDVMTGAYIFGGLRLPLGANVTVARGNKLVGALGPEDAKGYVNAVEAITDLPTDLEDVDAAAVDAFTKLPDVVNAAHGQINSISATVRNLINASNGKGTVIDFDDTDALVALI